MKQSKKEQLLFFSQFAFLIFTFKFSMIYIFEDVLGIYFFDNFSYLLTANFLAIFILRNLYQNNPRFVIK